MAKKNNKSSPTPMPVSAPSVVQHPVPAVYPPPPVAIVQETSVSTAIVAYTTTVGYQSSYYQSQSTSALNLGFSVTPYMRPVPIKFIGYGLRPEREIWYYFDNNDMQGYVEAPNIIDTSTYNPFDVYDLKTGTPDIVYVGKGMVAEVLCNETLYTDPTDSSTAFTRLYVTSFSSLGAGVLPIINGTPLSVMRANSQYESTVVDYTHVSGQIQVGSNTSTIFLSGDASSNNDWYNGNTISIVNGWNAGLSANIIGYNGLLHQANISPAFDSDFSSTGNGSPHFIAATYSIGDSRVNYAQNSSPSFFVSSTGYTSGVLHIPDPNLGGLKIPTGDRIFRILDNPRNDIAQYTTRADYDFISNLINTDKQQMVSGVSDNLVIPTFENIPTTPLSYPVASLPADPCLPDVANCSISVAGGCFVANGVANATVTNAFSGGYLLLDCLPRWRFTDSNGNVLRAVPNRQFLDSSIQIDAVNLNVPGAVNYASYGWTCGYHPTTGEAFTDTITNPLNVVFPAGTYVQYWSPATNGWGTTNDVSGLKPSDVFCKINQCAPKLSQPTAKSFFVSGTDHPDGVFLSSLDLFFFDKGTLPLEVQIRTMDGGLPTNNILPGACAVLDSSTVITTEYPDPNDSTTATTFTFPSPVYLAPSTQYCVVVNTDDWGYDIYVAELGQTAIATGQTVSKQPFSGSIFQSQDGLTWTAIQDTDLMITMRICSFTNTVGNVYFNEDKDREQAVATGNTTFDAFEVQSNSIQLPGTGLSYLYIATNNSSGTIDGSYTPIQADSRVSPSARKVLTSPTANPSFYSQIILSTSNPDVSPMVYHNQQELVAITNQINGLPISNTNINIVNGGASYGPSNTFITITGNNGISQVGYGANAYATITGGVITGIIVDNPGAGYADNVSIKIVGGNNTAIATFNSEISPQGGPAAVRYISEVVTLINGYNAGDLRVFVDADNPPTANVDIYYQVRNFTDPTQMADQNWYRMTPTTTVLHSPNGQQIEYEYAPSLFSNTISYTSGTATFKTFNQFAIKAVLSSTDNIDSVIPQLFNIKAIALPPDNS